MTFAATLSYTNRERPLSAEPFRVLDLTPDPYHGFGGIAQYRRDLIDALLGLDPRIEVESLPRNAPSSSPGRGDSTPRRFHERVTPSSPHRYATFALRRAREFQPDLVLCGHLALLPVAVAIKKLMGTPILAQAYGIDAWSPLHRSVAYSVRQIDHLMVISRATRERFLAWSNVSPTHVTLLPNAAPRDVPSEASLDRGVAELRTRYAINDRPVVLTLGRIDAREQYKGHDRILAALPAVLREQPNLLYLIAGDGTDRPRLEALVQQLSLHDSVRFVGKVSDDERWAHYRLADGFAMPSTGEGFGYVFLEAMACGTPVLGGSTDGSRDALADGELGLLVDPMDDAALARGIVQLVRQPRSVPPGLVRFAFDRFQRQLRLVLAPWFQSSNGGDV